MRTLFWTVFIAVGFGCHCETYGQLQGILREVDSGIAGGTVADLTNNPAFPNSPSSTTQSFTYNLTPLESSRRFAGAEPLGICSRRTGLVISEIMYHPAPRADSNNLEFVEIYNAQPYSEDISGYRLSGDIDFLFPSNTVLESHGFLVVAKLPEEIKRLYGIANVVGPYTNSLSNSAGTVRLRHRAGAILLEVNYSSEPPWPAAADGAGHSLVLARPSYGSDNVLAWCASEIKGGTPGQPETPVANPFQTVLINEFLAHTDEPEVDYVELYNYSAQSVDISGCWLSDDPATNKFTLPSGTVIPPLGFVVFTQTNLSFALDAAGETIYLTNPDQTRVIDAIRFGPQANGVPTGRYPDGAPAFRALSAQTPGAANAPILIHDIVINEIMYNPISGDSDDEYIELYNQGTNSISLAGWKFIAGIDYSFPHNTVLPAGGYLVVAKNAAKLMTRYSNLNASNTFGDYGGTLANGGERLALAMPETLVSTNARNVATTNRVFIVVDEVAYYQSGRWDKWADGGGGSLELIDPHSDHQQASNWAASDETAKSSWSTVEATGVLDLGVTAYQADSLQLLALGEGEFLIDNVEVIGASGVNLITNPTFETGVTGWVFQGNHDQTTWETAQGYNSTHSLHVKTSGRGDTGANRIRTPLSATVPVGSTATLRAKVRWLRGWPEVLLRLHGNYLEAAGAMSLPANLGTPGARNSRAVANAGPAIHDVVHSPILPRAYEAVVVTAQIGDPDSIAGATLKYRRDPSTSYTSVAMLDNGAGYFSAPIPGQAAGVLVAFSIEAQDGRSPSARAQFPHDAPTRECLVRFGETQLDSTFPTYRVWVTQATFTRWSNREKLHNGPLDATFVLGNQRVVYNVGALYSGSPFIATGYNTPTGALCGSVIGFPDDDVMFGVTGFTLDYLARDPAAVREQIACWMLEQMKAPFNRRYFVNLFFNGIRRGTIYEDAQQPDSDFIRSWFPDHTDGELFKLDDGFEFDDAGVNFSRDNNDIAATLENFTSGGVKKIARYRWHWRKRAVNGSASDYQSLFALVDAANAPTNTYAVQFDSLVDTEEWLRVFGIERIVGNYDSYGFNRGKNMFTYQELDGRWHMLPWDIDFVLGTSGGAGTTQAFLTAADPLMTKFYAYPPFQRAYYRILQEAVNGPLNPANLYPMIDARYNALVANGISATSPASAGIKTWIAARREYMLTNMLNKAVANFAITSNNGNNFSTNRNLLTLQGTASIGVKDIEINGVVAPVTWTTISNWTARLTLDAGTNLITVKGYDGQGALYANANAALTVTYTGATASPQGSIVINEIMYHPLVPDAEYVELFNASTNQAFDLSRWRIEGIDFTFPDGVVIRPQDYLVVVKDRVAFSSAYGSAIPVAGEFPGKLDNGGETLRLIQTGVTPEEDLVVDEVTFNDAAPWPAAADGGGSSLQLVDASQDNNRVSNWVSVTNPPSQTLDWQYVTASGVAANPTVYIYLNSAGDVYFDDMMLVLGTVPGVGANLIKNGDFEAPLSASANWTVSGNHSNSVISTTRVRSGNSSLHVIASGGGSGKNAGLWQNTLPVTTNATYTISFWYFPSINGTSLTVRGSGSWFAVSPTIGPGPVITTTYTPGAPNAIRTSLPVFPALYVNEIQSNNRTTRADGVGIFNPWLELYNAGANTLSLSGYYLTDSYSNLTQWAFPANASIDPGQFLVVWADGQTDPSSANELHANFRLSPTGGAIALTRVQNGQPAVFDYLNYPTLSPDRSFGCFPDGQHKHPQVFYYATPAATNNNASPPITVVINEWMAGNTHTLADPVDNRFDDWFELYNAGTNTVDLSGYTLTDSLANPTPWTIPDGVVIQPQGFLLVWADQETDQNGRPNSSDLHASFKLNQAGEVIGLFAPDGSLVDAITFTNQTADISEGRYPDGSTNIIALSTSTPRASNAAPLILIQAAPSPAYDALILNWNTESGRTYRVQYRLDFNTNSWLDGTALTATGDTLTATHPIVTTNLHRYFRIRQEN